MDDRWDLLSLIGRRRPVFAADFERHRQQLEERIHSGSFLVLGGAGSIGQAVVRRLFRNNPKRLHVVDVSENNLVELVRQIRSTYGYNDGDFQTLPLDIGSVEFDAFMEASRDYDFVLNFSALKHVRSEKDPFSLMRMIAVNVLNTERTLRQAIDSRASGYFSVSSDKAANPVSAMGASKRAMELCLARAGRGIQVSSARFANVAFSDGSLLYGFRQRLARREPFSAPRDVRRYFITDEEAAILCLMACLVGNNRDVFFPNVEGDLEAIDFPTIAERFLHNHGYRAYRCADEDEARARVDELSASGLWPCHFFATDTTGEKEIEEFCMADEVVDVDRYAEIGVVEWPEIEDGSALDRFVTGVAKLRDSGRWTRRELLDHLSALLPEFRHQETGKFLDARM